MKDSGSSAGIGEVNGECIARQRRRLRRVRGADRVERFGAEERLPLVKVGHGAARNLELRGLDREVWIGGHVSVVDGEHRFPCRRVAGCLRLGTQSKCGQLNHFLSVLEEIERHSLC